MDRPLSFHQAASALLLLCLGTTSHADVTSKAATGFNLTITADVPVDADTAYNQFINVGDWWVASHTYSGRAENLSIEPRAGGCFCERDGDQEVLHMLVPYVQPGREIRMVGGLGPLQMMGVHGGMRWTFEALPEGGTRITQTYNVTGYAQGGLDRLADIVHAVQTGQHDALVSKLTAAE